MMNKERLSGSSIEAACFVVDDEQGEERESERGEGGGGREEEREPDRKEKVLEHRDPLDRGRGIDGSS